MLCVLEIICSAGLAVLFSQEENPPGDVTMNPFNWELSLPLAGHLGLFRFRNLQAKKGVSLLTGVIDLLPRKKLGYCSVVEARQSMPGTQAIP